MIRKTASDGTARDRIAGVVGGLLLSFASLAALDQAPAPAESTEAEPVAEARVEEGKAGDESTNLGKQGGADETAQFPPAEELPLEIVTVLPEDDVNWFDSSHGYMTDRTNALTRWVDDYFGEPESDLEEANSRLRVRFISDFDERLGNDFRVRLRGKVNLPRISRRVDLVFQGDDPEDEGNTDPATGQDRVGLQVQLGNTKDDASRFDFTLGMSSSGPRPGLRYRYYGQIAEEVRTRFIQRLQYEFDDGAVSTSQLFLDYNLTDRQLLRSGSRVRYGESTDGFEWSTSISHVSLLGGGRSEERASFAYVEMTGQTEPFDYVSNYRVGWRFRQQFFREFLFFDVEPSYNWRIDQPGFDREGAWRIRFQVEVLLDQDLRRDGGYASR